MCCSAVEQSVCVRYSIVRGFLLREDVDVGHTGCVCRTTLKIVVHRGLTIAIR